MVASGRIELTFATPELEAIANSSLELDQHFGPEADLVRQRLCELVSAENLGLLPEIPTLRFAPLPNGQFCVAVGGVRRIRFTAAPAAGDVRGHARRQAELHTITTIQILGIG